MIDYNITASGILLGLFYMGAMQSYFEAKSNLENKRKVHISLFIWPSVNFALFWIISHL